MYSPMYDLAQFDGKASLDITLASDDATSATISLAELGTGDVLNEFEKHTVPVSKEMTTHHIEFSKGTEQCCVLIHFDFGYYLNIKDLKLTVNMTEGGKIEIPFDSKVIDATEEQCFPVNNIEIEESNRLSYDVIAALSNEEIYVESPKSERMYVDIATSIKDINMSAKPTVRINGDELYVENPDSENVEVFNAEGVKLLENKSGNTVVKTRIPYPGIYIVKVGNKVTKVYAAR